MRNGMKEKEKKTKNAVVQNQILKMKHQLIYLNLEVLKKTTKSIYHPYFNFKWKSEEKFGICILCEKKKLSKEVTMKSGNTSGLKQHLKLYHIEEYEQKFEKKDTTMLKRQRTLEDMNSFSLVSI